MSATGNERRVGPVLHATPFARAVVAAIEQENDEVLVQDEGAYLRVLVPWSCQLSRAGLEAATGYEIRFPADLELVMSSFTGALEISGDTVVWRLAEERRRERAARPGGADG